MNVKSDVSTIYKYISNNIVTPTLVNLINLRAKMTNIWKIPPEYLSLPSNPETNIWPYYKSIKVHPITLNDTIKISTVVLLINNPFHLQLYQLHSVSMLKTMLHKSIQIELTNAYLVITDDKQCHASPRDSGIMKCLISRRHFCSLSGSLFPVKGTIAHLHYTSKMTKMSKCIAQFQLITSMEIL